jgi:hypothetical protein
MLIDTLWLARLSIGYVMLLWPVMVMLLSIASAATIVTKARHREKLGRRGFALALPLVFIGPIPFWGAFMAHNDPAPVWPVLVLACLLLGELIAGLKVIRSFPDHRVLSVTVVAMELWVGAVFAFWSAMSLVGGHM